MSSVRGNPTTLPTKVSVVETQERFRVGNSPFQERVGRLGLGMGGFSYGPSGLGLGEA